MKQYHANESALVTYAQSMRGRVLDLPTSHLVLLADRLATGRRRRELVRAEKTLTAEAAYRSGKDTHV